MVRDLEEIVNEKMGLSGSQIAPRSQTNNQVFRIDSAAVKGQGRAN